MTHASPPLMGLLPPWLVPLTGLAGRSTSTPHLTHPLRKSLFPLCAAGRLTRRVYAAPGASRRFHRRLPQLILRSSLSRALLRSIQPHTPRSCFPPPRAYHSTIAHSQPMDRPSVSLHSLARPSRLPSQITPFSCQRAQARYPI
jgi:hypothetical protein